MAIADLAEYQEFLESPSQRMPFSKVSIVTVQGRLYDLWDVATDAGVVPTTQATPRRSTVGVLGQRNPAGVLNLIKIISGSSAWGAWQLCDRLSHQGGLSATDITAQVTNLPTAAYERYTDGVGVMIGLTIYTQIGTTGTTVTASYTNQAGTGGRTTPATVFGGTGFREARRMIQLPLQEGDYGVRSVESVTVLASTLTAGNFGVTLFKPLVMASIPVVSQDFEWDALLSLGANAPDTLQNAALFWTNLPLSTASGIFTGEVLFAET